MSSVRYLAQWFSRQLFFFPRRSYTLAREAVAVITCACLCSVTAVDVASMARGQDHVKVTHYCNALARYLVRQVVFTGFMASGQG